jgi:hypothetical protein
LSEPIKCSTQNCRLIGGDSVLGHGLLLVTSSTLLAFHRFVSTNLGYPHSSTGRGCLQPRPPTPRTGDTRQYTVHSTQPCSAPLAVFHLGSLTATGGPLKRPLPHPCWPATRSVRCCYLPSPEEACQGHRRWNFEPEPGHRKPVPKMPARLNL